MVPSHPENWTPDLARTERTAHKDSNIKSTKERQGQVQTEKEDSPSLLGPHTYVSSGGSGEHGCHLAQWCPVGQAGGVLGSLWSNTSEDTVLPPSWLLVFIPSYLGAPLPSGPKCNYLQSPWTSWHAPFPPQVQTPRRRNSGLLPSWAAAPTWPHWGEFLQLPSHSVRPPCASPVTNMHSPLAPPGGQGSLAPHS